MKKIALLLFFVLAFSTVFSQDILVYKNGDEIKAVVTEVNTGDVKYKKWDNQTGPSYTVLKSDLFMIKYKNGSKDVFKDETPQVVTQPNTNTNNNGAVNNNNNAPANNGAIVYESRPATTPNTMPVDNLRKENYDKYMRKARQHGGAGGALTAVGGGLLLIGIIALSAELLINEDIGDTDDPLFIIGIAGAVVGTPLFIVGLANLGSSARYRRKAKEYATLGVSPSVIKYCAIDGSKSFAPGITLSYTFPKGKK